MSSRTALKALVVDVGNTRVRLADWRGGRQALPPVGRASGGGPMLAEPVPTLGVWNTPDSGAEETLVAALTEVRTAHPGVPVVVSCVVPRLVPLFHAVWSELLVVDHNIDLPFRLELPDPAAIGADRLCNMAAAATYGRALVVDAGTATTFDLLLDGEFVGGLIAPGMASAAAGLAEKAPRLAPVPFAPCPLEPGRDTVSALRAGIFHTGVGGVEMVVAQLCRRYEPLPVVVTGGLGHLLAESGRLCDPDWTVRGAAILAGLA